MTVSLFVSIHVSFDSIGLYDSIGLVGNILRISTGGVKQHNHDKNIQKACQAKMKMSQKKLNISTRLTVLLFCKIRLKRGMFPWM